MTSDICGHFGVHETTLTIDHAKLLARAVDDIKRGLMMIAVPVAAVFLSFLMVATEVALVQALGALLLISSYFLGFFCLPIGTIYVLIGGFSLLKQRFFARRSDA